MTTTMIEQSTFIVSDYVHFIVKNTIQFDIINFNNQPNDLQVQNYIRTNMSKDGNIIQKIITNLYAEKEYNSENILRLFLIVLNQEENIKKCCNTYDNMYTLPFKLMKNNRKSLIERVKHHDTKLYEKLYENLNKILNRCGKHPIEYLGTPIINKDTCEIFFMLQRLNMLKDIKNHIIKIYKFCRFYELNYDEIKTNYNSVNNDIKQINMYAYDILQNTERSNITLNSLFGNDETFNIIKNIFSTEGIHSLHEVLINLISFLFFPNGNNVEFYHMIYDKNKIILYCNLIYFNFLSIIRKLNENNCLKLKDSNDQLFIIYSKDFNLEKLKHVITQQLNSLYQTNEDILIRNLFPNDITNINPDENNKEKWNNILEMITTNKYTYQLTKLYPNQYNDVKKLHEYDPDFLDATITMISSKRYPLFFDNKTLIAFLYHTRIKNDLYPNKLYEDIIDNYCRGGITEMILTIKFLEVADTLNMTQQDYNNFI